MISLVPFLPALALEAVFYFLPVCPAFRRRFSGLHSLVQAALLWLSAMLPVLGLNLAQGQFPADFALWATATGIVCGWYLVLPRRPVADVLLMGLMVAFILSDWFLPLFVQQRFGGLNKLLWMRLGMAVFLFLRRIDVPGFGLWPNRREWVEGIRQFVFFLVILLPIGLGFKLLRYQLPKVEAWQLPFLAVGTLLGFYLFVAFGEDFFFRGVLQPMLGKELGNRWLGLLMASLCFGAVHLPFRGFPNWRQAAVSAVLGVFCGIGFERANSLRASMITHALVVTVWTIFFARSF